MSTPEKLMDILCGRSPRNLRGLFAVVASEFNFSALGFVKWDRRKKRIRTIPDAFWCADTLKNDMFAYLAEEGTLRTACSGPNFFFVRTSTDLATMRLEQLGLCPLKVPTGGVPSRLPEGMPFCLVYVSTSLTLEPGGVPHLPFDTRNCRIVCHFAGAYANIVQDLSRPKIPHYAGFLMEQAMMLAFLQSALTKVSEDDELVRLAFLRWGEGYGVSGIPDGEMEQNRRSYFAFSQAIPQGEQNEWLVFGSGEKLAEGKTQNEALLQAREAIRDKPNIRLYLFRRGGRIRRLGYPSANIALDLMGGKDQT